MEQDLCAIIFDITGVIFPHQPWAGERPSKEKLAQIKQLVVDIYDEERMSKEFLKEKLFQIDRPREELDAIYNSLSVIDEKLFELIKKLSVRYSLYAMANEATCWTDIRKSLFGFNRYFKKMYISIEVGLRKPDEGIYRLFLNETGINPNKCLFVDDKDVNVSAAEKLGFQGYVYTDFLSFEHFLKARGYI